MSKFKDLTGTTFGRLTVIERAENNKNGEYCWLCRCTCGNETIVTGNHLSSGHTLSCGCLRTEQIATLHKTHGMSKSKIYTVYSCMKDRCLRANASSYKDYGGRGITVYEPWVNDFRAFYDYVSRLEHFSEDGYSLDRINNDGNYEPGNLRWATRAEQNSNRRNNILVEYNGQQMTIAEVSRIIHVSPITLSIRYKKGDRGERLFRPVHKTKQSS